MDYDSVATITQVAALIFFIVLFLVVVAYACWPGNKKQFEKDAKIPLQRDPDLEKDKD
jgi:cytochrome c oxidase cbb3-type subunit 4